MASLVPPAVSADRQGRRHTVGLGLPIPTRRSFLINKTYCALSDNFTYPQAMAGFEPALLSDLQGPFDCITHHDVSIFCKNSPGIRQGRATRTAVNVIHTLEATFASIFYQLTPV